MSDAMDIRKVVDAVIASAFRDVLSVAVSDDGSPPPPSVPGPAPPPALPAKDRAICRVASELACAKNVIVMVGAGMSTAAGIPDFRSPGTGLYYQLEKYDLPNPQAIFSIDYFKERPEPFHLLAREMWPGNFSPTHAHAFLRLLADRNQLLRVYTQNIDGLERLAGVPPERLVECHGTFASAHAVDPPHAEVDIGWYKSELDRGNTRIEHPETGGLVKPDIVFFGEALPAHFFPSVQEDFPECDLLLVIGTSLAVMPFAGLVRMVPKATRRVLINMTEAGSGLLDFSHAADDDESGEAVGANSLGAEDFVARPTRREKRDVALLGDCQATVRALAAELGWTDVLEGIHAAHLEAAQCKVGDGAGSEGQAPVAKEGGGARTDTQGVGKMADELAAGILDMSL